MVTAASSSIWTPAAEISGGARCDAAATVYQWTHTTGGLCPPPHDIGDYLLNCDLECAKTACAMRANCGGMTQAVPVGSLHIAEYKLSSNVGTQLTQPSAGSSHTYSCWRRGHAVQSVPATVMYGPTWGQLQPRSPSTHGVFDINFSLKTYFEDLIINPRIVGSLTIPRASIKWV